MVYESLKLRQSISVRREWSTLSDIASRSSKMMSIGNCSWQHGEAADLKESSLDEALVREPGQGESRRKSYLDCMNLYEVFPRMTCITEKTFLPFRLLIYIFFFSRNISEN